MNVLEVLVGAEMEFGGFGEKVEALGMALGAFAEIEVEFETLLAQLLFEERVEDDGGGPGVFEAADVGEVLGERGSGGDEWGPKVEAEIAGGEVEHNFFLRSTVLRASSNGLRASKNQLIAQSLLTTFLPSLASSTPNTRRTCISRRRRAGLRPRGASRLRACSWSAF